MTDSYYFPHYFNSRQDRTLKRLMKKDSSNECYGIYFMLLEVLRSQNNFMYPLADIDLLEDEFFTSKEKIEEVIKYGGLFELTETDNGYFFSTSLIHDMKKMDTHRINGLKGVLVRVYNWKKNDLLKYSPEQIVDLYHKEKGVPVKLIGNKLTPLEAPSDHKIRQDNIIQDISILDVNTGELINFPETNEEFLH